MIVIIRIGRQIDSSPMPTVTQQQKYVFTRTRSIERFISLKIISLLSLIHNAISSFVQFEYRFILCLQVSCNK